MQWKKHPKVLIFGSYLHHMIGLNKLLQQVWTVNHKYAPWLPDYL